MLKCNNIALSAGSKQLFEMDELQLEKGLFAIVGRNGSGKSTFLNAILGNHSLSSGKIELDGIDTTEIKSTELAKSVSLVRSKPFVFGDYKVYDILLLGRLPHQDIFARATKNDKEVVDRVADMLKISGLKNTFYANLSDGEKQMVLVARALIQDTPIVLLDEPAAFLDLVNRRELLDVLKKISEEKLILFSTHHIAELNNLCDGVLLIHQSQMKLYKEETNYTNLITKAFDL